MSRRIKAPSRKAALPRWAREFEVKKVKPEIHVNSRKGLFIDLAECANQMGVAARRAAEFCEEEMRDEVRRAFDLGNKIGFLTGRGAALLSLVDPLEQHAARTQALARVNRASVTKKRSTLGTDYVSSPVTEEDRARIEVLDRQLGSEFSKPYARAREIAARLGIKQRRVEYVMGLRRKK